MANIQSVIDEFNSLYGEKFNDASYVYSASFDGNIGIMQKLPDTITNEDKIVYDSNYALYTANKLMFVALYSITELKLFDVCCPESPTNTKVIFRTPNADYYLGDKIIHEPNIHYCKTFNAILYPVLMANYQKVNIDGIYKVYHYCGRINIEGQVISQRRKGTFTFYTTDGIRSSERIYDDDIVIAETKFYNDETISCKMEKNVKYGTFFATLYYEFPNRKKAMLSADNFDINICIAWHANGKLKIFFMKKDQKQERFVAWDEDGNKTDKYTEGDMESYLLEAYTKGIC